MHCVCFVMFFIPESVDDIETGSTSCSGSGPRPPAIHNVTKDLLLGEEQFVAPMFTCFNCTQDSSRQSLDIHSLELTWKWRMAPSSEDHEIHEPNRW